MLEGAISVWFEDVRAGVLERLLRLSRLIPADVELGYHLCYGDDEHGHFVEPQDTLKLVGVANALAAGIDRPLNWIHMPVPVGRGDDRFFVGLEQIALHPETELYLGLVHIEDGAVGARLRIAAAQRHVASFGVATECGWGRGDNVEHHGWYDNLQPTVEALAVHLADGDVLLDYSGGTGILLDRLRLRVFDRAVGTVIVDASAKFLRVALQKYRDDPLVALRLLRFLRDERRLESLDEVLGAPLRQRGVDAVACTNAIHL